MGIDRRILVHQHDARLPPIDTFLRPVLVCHSECFLCTQPAFVIREVLESSGDVIEYGVIGVFVEVVDVEIRVPVHVFPCQDIS